MWDAEPVVIVGANMAGLTAARTLSGHTRARVFDASESAEWLPNIHELISAAKRPQNLRLARAPIVHHYGHDFARKRVVRVDWRRHVLAFDDGSEEMWSQLILAVGGCNNTFGVPGAAEHALPFKSVANCQRIAKALARLAAEPAGANVVLVGAGIEGVEALGEILRRYRRHPGLSLTVVESGPRLLPALPERIHERLLGHCEQASVSFRFGRKVTAVNANSVSLDDGEDLPADLVIWTGGVAPNPLIADSGLGGADGFVPVSASLQSEQVPGLFAVGDCVGAVAGTRIARQAYHAMDMGRQAAANVLARQRHRPLQPFRPANKPQLVTFGDQDALLLMDGQVIAGASLRVLKEAIYQAGMAQLDARQPRRRMSALARRLIDSGVDEAIGLLRAPPALADLLPRRFRH